MARMCGATHASPGRPQHAQKGRGMPRPYERERSWAMRRARSFRPSGPPPAVYVTPAFRAGALLVLKRATHICADDAHWPLPPARPDRPAERIAGGDRGHAAIILAPGDLDRPGEVGSRERQQRSHKHKHPRHGSRIRFQQLTQHCRLTQMVRLLRPIEQEKYWQ
jgi:hypothetical protein